MEANFINSGSHLGASFRPVGKTPPRKTSRFYDRGDFPTGQNIAPLNHKINRFIKGAFFRPVGNSPLRRKIGGDFVRPCIGATIAFEGNSNLDYSTCRKVLEM